MSIEDKEYPDPPFQNWQHVYPIGDLITHVTEWGIECPCGPQLDFKDQIVTHYAMDGRPQDFV